MSSKIEKMAATDLEVNREKSDAVAEDQEVPKKEAAVETIETLEHRYLAARHHRQPKKRTQGDSGYRKKLADPRIW
jgi:hypothetical protein